jgi:hypothetical protein
MTRLRPLVFVALLSVISLTLACSKESTQPSTPTTPTPASPTTPPGPVEPPPTPPQPVACTYAAIADPDDFERDGGNGALRIGTTPGCRWSVTSDAAWAVVEGAQQGEGPAVLKVFVQPNDTESARQMAFTVADQVARVVQPGQADCRYEVSPVTVAIPRTASSGQISIATSRGCQWQVTSDASWLRPRSSGGSGSATVPYDADFNAESGRSVTRLGVLAFRWRAPTAGQNVRVTQWPSCSIGVGPATGGLPPGAAFTGALPGNWTVTASADGGTFHLWVLTEPFMGCPWTVESTDTWLTITSPRVNQVMSGDGDLFFTLPPNPTSQTRRATLTFEGKPLTITQAGR